MTIERRTKRFGITTERVHVGVGASEYFSAGKNRKKRLKVKVPNDDQLQKFLPGTNGQNDVFLGTVYDNAINKDPDLRGGRIWNRSGYNRKPSK